VTYLITFACYGCHLHGDPSGSVHRDWNLPGGPLLEADTKICLESYNGWTNPLYGLDASRRRVVLSALRQRCQQQQWTLLAAHVRSNHVHIVVDAEVRPERIMNDLKAYASRCLNQSGLDGATRKRWARHGSTRWFWKPEHVSAAIRYVVDEQGEAMAVFEAVES